MAGDKDEERELMHDVIAETYKTALLDEGVDEKFLAKLLKKGLTAKESKFVKMKGYIDSSAPFANVKRVAKTTEEVLFELKLDAHGIQQKAREDAQKVFDLYPAERHHHDHNLEVVVVDKFPEGKEGEDNSST